MPRLLWHGLLLGFLFLLPAVLQAQEASVQDDFVLGPGDVLDISVWKDEALTREVVVRPDGMISFPLAGQLQVAGLSVQEVEDELQQLLQKYVPDSPVTVSLAQLNSTKIYVVGKVNDPGMHLMQGRTTVMQALALSGGLDRFAKEKHIKVLRNNSGQQEVLQVNYAELADGESLDSNIELQPGDTIVVP